MPFPSSSRIAVSELILPNGTKLHNQVIELQSHTVIRYYPLVAELPHTEWHCATFLLTQAGTLIKA